MDTTDATNALNEFGATSGLAHLVAEYAWLFCVAFALLLFKASIENGVAGMQVFFGDDYNNDDAVVVDGRPGRIVRVHLTKTVFYLYTLRKGVVTGGTKLAVANTALKDMRIEKQLEKLVIDDIWHDDDSGGKDDE